ncbi:PREDICTED: basic blue protein [Fragaria vesca subsp. vesca]|uniref:basic blue protein n=1 Tax=Fragaria vesca subsp. vesca TaxID=101020 RepID=UPI0002C36935|nr:PREDICTED: basic blue protein [Fragaria vesca subsp. vesca]
MNSQGRGSARFTVVQVVAVLLCLMAVQYVDAATYTVGDSGGWSFNTGKWPNGKQFRAGDVLIFNYDSTLHNVVAVGRGGYSSCTTPRGAKVLTSGNDRVKLAKGQNYFICNFPGHCESGMKVAINAV